MELNPETVLRPYVTEGASALRPEALFGGASHTDSKAAPIPDGSADSLRLSIQPWHRHAIQYLALQMEPKQVAAACDVTVQTIYALLKTPWFSELLDSAIKESKKDLMALVDANALTAMTTIVEIMNDTKVKAETRSMNAKMILEWKLGKPTQRIEAVAGRVESADPVAEEAELLRLERECENLKHA